MMSSTTRSNSSCSRSASASRPPEQCTGRMPSTRKRVSTSSAIRGWSSTMRIRGLLSVIPTPLLLRSSHDPVAIELAVQRPARQPEKPRRLDALAARRLQRAQNLIALGGLERELAGAVALRRLDALLGQQWGKMLGQDHRAPRHDERPLDDVGELAHVAGPGVA